MLFELGNDVLVAAREVRQKAGGAVLDAAGKHFIGAAAVGPKDEIQRAITVLAVEDGRISLGMAWKIPAPPVLIEIK